MMGNPFYGALGGGRMSGQMGGFTQMIQQFNQFKSTFKGDPKAEVERLVQSGQISQDQLNQLQGLAAQFGHLFR